MQVKPLHIFSLLCFFYLIYSFHLYLSKTPLKKIETFNATKGAQGRIIFQKYNCQDCHQLYGLGGYLGPDLTNVYSKYGKNAKTLKTFFKGGFLQMPTFHLSPKEADLLVDFFKMTDASGNADPRSYQKLPNGMIEPGN